MSSREIDTQILRDLDAFHIGADGPRYASWLNKHTPGALPLRANELELLGEIGIDSCARDYLRILMPHISLRHEEHFIIAPHIEGILDEMNRAARRGLSGAPLDQCEQTDECSVCGQDFTSCIALRQEQWEKIAWNSRDLSALFPRADIIDKMARTAEHFEILTLNGVLERMRLIATCDDITCDIPLLHKVADIFIRLLKRTVTG